MNGISSHHSSPRHAKITWSSIFIIFNLLPCLWDSYGQLAPKQGDRQRNDGNDPPPPLGLGSVEPIGWCLERLRVPCDASNSWGALHHFAPGRQWFLGRSGWWQEFHLKSQKAKPVAEYPVEAIVLEVIWGLRLPDPWLWPLFMDK